MRRTVAICVVLVAGTAVASAADPREAAELRQGILDAEKRIVNISMTLEITAETRPPGSAGFMAPSNSVASLTVDKRGRVKYERTGYTITVAGKKEAATVTRGAFNGEVYKEETDYRTPSGGKTTSTGEMKNTTDGIWWGLDPKECMWHYLGRPIAAILESPGVDSLAPVADRPGAVAVETVAVPHDDTKAKYRFIIDRRRGFAVTTREALILLPKDKKWAVYGRTVYKSLKEVEQGIWLPDALEAEAFRISDSSMVPFTRTVAQLTNTTVNRDIRDDYFEMRFLDGTKISDRRNGKTLIAATRGGESPASIAASGEELFLQESQPASGLATSARTALWAAGFGAVCLLAAGGRVWAARRRVQAAPPG